MPKKQNLAQRNNRRRKRGLSAAKGVTIPTTWLIAIDDGSASHYYRNKREV